MKNDFKVIGIAACLLFILMMCGVFFSNDKSDNAVYRIIGGNERVYYANTFRCSGRWIVFDDVYGKKIILTGNIDIEKINNL